MTSITPALTYGNVKIIGVGIDPNMKNRGLEKILLRAIFTIIPATKRLFLFTRPTNENDLKIYRDLGFTEDLHPIEDPKHKVDMEFLSLMEYKIKNLSILQPFFR
jgi:ribosomal protein S18 acetylase RimI-like enzyme